MISQSSFSSSFLTWVILPSIVLSLLVTIIVLYPNSWIVSDADHFYFEIFAFLLSTIVAIYCIARASLLHEKFSLFVGVGFATLATVDLLHAVFSYYNEGNPDFLNFFIPQTWFAGRTFLGIMLAIAVIKYAAPPAADIIADSKEKQLSEQNAAISSSTTNMKAIRKNNNNINGDAKQDYSDRKYGSSSNQYPPTTTIEYGGDGSNSKSSGGFTHHLESDKMLLFSLLLFSTLAVGIVVISFFTYFPSIRLTDFPIHRPYEIPALVLFVIALVYFYRKKLYRANDAFYKGILGAIIIDIFGQVIMSYSAINFYTAHNVAHILKDSGYFIIIISLVISSIQYNRLAREREEIIRLQYTKLREADKMKDEFINTAAHELRTPIQPILGLSQILRSRIADDTNNNNNNLEQSQFLDIIIRNAKRLHRLTENILDVTRIESSTFKLRKEWFDLNDVILSAIDDTTLDREFLRKQQSVRISYHPKPILVYGDRTRIAQVIGNLIGNAIKFTAEGTISITAEEKSSKSKEAADNNGKDEIITVSVQDTGQGIDPHIFPALFTKFTSNSDFGGTGLGLFISKKIIETHGGTIWAENNGEGKKGATFTFTIPKDDQASLLGNGIVANSNSKIAQPNSNKMSQKGGVEE